MRYGEYGESVMVNVFYRILLVLTIMVCGIWVALLFDLGEIRGHISDTLHWLEMLSEREEV